VKDLLKRQTLKEPKLVQLDKVLHKWSTAMRSEGKLMPGPMDKCRFSDSCLQNFKKCHGIRTLDISGEVVSTAADGVVTKEITCKNLGQYSFHLPVSNIQ
jgi:hypothetical protein